jgi:hypothetical protein
MIEEVTMKTGDVLLGCGVRGFGFQIDTVYLRLNRFEYISARDFATPSCVVQRGCRNVTVQQMMSSALRSAEAQQRWIAYFILHIFSCL